MRRWHILLVLTCLAVQPLLGGTSGSNLKPSDYDRDGLTDTPTESVSWHCTSVGDPLTTLSAQPASEYRSPRGQFRGTVHLVDSGNDIGAWSIAPTRWGDYDGDGDLDLLIAGALSGADPPQTTKIFTNDGSGNLSEDTSQDLIGVCGGRSSSGWVDIDKDGDLDLFLSGYDGSQYRTAVYRNDGYGAYTLDQDQSLMAVTSSAMDWGDFDNDGDLDLIFIGTTTPYPFTSRTKLYLNDGSGNLVEDTSQSLTGVAFGDVEWGDVNNDGHLDLVISGSCGTLADLATIVYCNDGDGHLLESQALLGLIGSSLAWGDYDQDGDLDLVLSGFFSNILYSIVYRNDGTGVFSEDGSQTITPMDKASAAWCDYDNDGDLDFSVAGYVDDFPYSKCEIYYNDGFGGLIEDTSQDIIAAGGNGSLAWGDYDDDGDLDLVLVGYRYTGARGWVPIGKVYNNNASEVVGPNIPPSPPTVLCATEREEVIVFEWSSGFDAETSANALTYNLRVGSVPGGCDVYYAHVSDTNSTPHFGNCWHTFEKVLNRVSGVDQYYWSVQTVDNGLERSDWAPEQVALKGDLDGDGDVDLADLAQLLGNYGTTAGATYEDGDLDDDGDVDLSDLAMLLSWYGTACE